MNNPIKKEIRVFISASKEEMSVIKDQYETITGTTDPFADRTLFDKLHSNVTHRFNLNDMTLDEANEKVELLRILMPDRNISLYSDDGDFIGHTTWNDQMEMFFEYKTYTPLGSMIAKARQIVAKEQGILASYC